VAETLRTGNAQYKRCHGWNMENEKREWDINTYPVLNLDGKVGQVVTLEQDITEKRKLEAEIIQNEKLVAVGHLAAIVAHEINNPLTSILANAQMLRLDLDPEQTELVESVKLIELAGVRATKVVENLQSMIRQGEFEFQYFDLNQSIQNALFLVSHEFISRQITIRFNRGEGLPEIYGSENHLQGVWANLLINSIEAIDSGKGEIKIDTLYDEGKFYVEIKDTGMGISEENLSRIFEPFFTTKKSGRGTGLGLSLARRIIRAHDGQIHVESSPGEGTRFTIMLPERQEQDVGVIPKEDLGLI
jgi:two-component system NtrC family sensor kinase